jgi:hypothetical protein
LNVIHERLEHGAELTCVRRERLTPPKIGSLVSKKSDLAVFRDITPLSGPNIMPKTIAEKLKIRLKGR